MAYVADPTNAAKPADGDDASGGAAEFRALKAYLQTLLNNGSSIPVNGYAWQGFRNKIINGNFDIWQRGTSLGALAASRYLADRWVTTGNGSTTAISQQAFTLGQTAVPYEPRFFHRVVVASVAGAGNWAFLQHRIESVRTFAGQTATLSFYAKADAVRNIAIELQQNFGTGGSPSADVTAIGVTTKSLTTGFTLYTVTVNVPSITGKTLGSNGDDYLTINFWFDAGSTYNARTNSLGQQSGTFDIAQVQFESGTNTTPFELLPPAIIFEQCQRYYETGNFSIRMSFTPIYGNSDWIGTNIAFNTSKRKVLVVGDIVLNNTSFSTNMSPGTLGTNVLVSPRQASAQGFSVGMGGNGGSSPGSGNFCYYEGTFAASAEL